MNLTLRVAGGVVSFNGIPVGLGVVSTLRLNANLYEKLRSTGKIVSATKTSVVIQASVVEQIAAGRSLISVQELIRFVV